MIRPDAATNRIKKRHADLHPEPMFDLGDTPNPEPKPKAAKAAARRQCTSCGDLVGLDAKRRPDLRRVLVWRPHYRKTYGGVDLLCPVSGTEFDPTPTTGDRP